MDARVTTASSTASDAISAFVICKNEKATIRRCLESLAFCREIVVVDSGSTDGTLEIIRELADSGLPIHLFEREWTGYASQKQFALDATSCRWCFSLDADEYVDDALREEIRSLPLTTTDVSGFWVRRREYLPGYGYPPAFVHARYILRLVRKDRAKYDQSLYVHESLQAEGATTRLKRGVLMHQRYLSVSTEAAVMNKYSTLKADEKFATGRRTNLARIAFFPLMEFIKAYVVQRFCFCGKAGLIHSMMRASYVFFTEAKLYRHEFGQECQKPRDNDL